MHRKLSILVLVKFLIRLPQNDERAREEKINITKIWISILYIFDIIFCQKLFKFHVVDFSIFFWVWSHTSTNDMAMIGLFQSNFNYDWPLCCVIFTSALRCGCAFFVLLSFVCTVIVLCCVNNFLCLNFFSKLLAFHWELWTRKGHLL